jgi:hypothetical protein
MSRPAPAILLSVLAGCGATAGAPQLYLGNFQGPFQVELAWTHPVGEVRGYAVEIRTIPGTFQVMKTYTPDTLSDYMYYPPNAPDGADLEIRIRALPDDDGSRASNAVSTHRPLEPPNLSCAPYFDGNVCLATTDGFHLTFSKASPSADSLELRRAVLSPVGPPSNETVLLVSSTATSYVDSDRSLWVHGARYRYTLTASKGAERSSSSLTTAAAPP